MNVSLSQIQTVLKTYSRQLKKEKTDNSSSKKEGKLRELLDQVTISSEAKKRQLIEQILSQAIGRYTGKET
jgi:hypothetical protein